VENNDDFFTRPLKSVTITYLGEKKYTLTVGTDGKIHIDDKEQGRMVAGRKVYVDGKEYGINDVQQFLHGMVWENSNAYNGSSFEYAD